MSRKVLAAVLTVVLAMQGMPAVFVAGEEIQEDIIFAGDALETLASEEDELLFGAEEEGLQLAETPEYAVFADETADPDTVLEGFLAEPEDQAGPEENNTPDTLFADEPAEADAADVITAGDGETDTSAAEYSEDITAPEADENTAAPAAGEDTADIEDSLSGADAAGEDSLPDGIFFDDADAGEEFSEDASAGEEYAGDAFSDEEADGDNVEDGLFPEEIGEEEIQGDENEDAADPEAQTAEDDSAAPTELFEEETETVSAAEDVTETAEDLSADGFISEEAGISEEEEKAAEPQTEAAEEELAAEEDFVAAAAEEKAAKKTPLSDLFPDAAFRAYIKANYGTVFKNSDSLTDAQVTALKNYLNDNNHNEIKTLDLSGYAVTNLKGIELFTKVETLKLSGNTGIKSVSLSSNPTIVEVDLSRDTKLTSLVLTGCTKLQRLNISGCSKLKSVNLDACTGLIALNAVSSGLESLSVSKNTKLEDISCSNTQIAALDVSANTALRRLECSNTLLSSITLGTNSNLFYLYLGDNKGLSKIDVSKVTALRELQLQNTRVVDLNLSNHASLYDLDLTNTPLKTLNLSGCKAIENIDVNDATGKGWKVTTISTLDVSNCTALRTLYCAETALNSLKIAGCSTLEYLACNDTAISALGLGDCTALHTLYIGHTAISSLDVSKNKNLSILDCNNTGIGTLNVTGNESLAYLNVEETGIGFLDLRKNPRLSTLYCGRMMTKLYLNELKDNASGRNVVILRTDRYNNSSAKIIAYHPLNGISWNAKTRENYKSKSANIIWWPYDPQTETIYCQGAETENGKKSGEHNWVTVYDTKPTCSKDGKTHIQCKACGTVQAGTSKVVKATGKHKYGKWTVKYAANAYSPKIEHRICKYCKKEETRKKGKALKAGTAVFRNLQAKAATVNSTSVKVTWNYLKNADVYLIYGSACGQNLKYLTSVSKPKKAVKTLSYTQKKLKAGTYYKYAVAAYKKNADGSMALIEASALVHAPTAGGKLTDYKKATINRKTVTLKKSKTYVLKAVGDKKDKTKSTPAHVGIRYESSNKKVVTVNKKGKIKAVGKGTAYVYAYLTNGMFARAKVTVK